MKGIVLAGGTGSRLWPLTVSISKQLLPVYDKPLIYYPLATLMQAGIQDILIITTSHDQTDFIKLLGDGNAFGINLSYAIQSEPRGLAEAFLIGKTFIEDEDVALILGDNLFAGIDFTEAMEKFKNQKGAHIFAYEVSNPSAYGVLEISDDGRPISILEKPQNPNSNWAVTGLYLLDKSAHQFASEILPSARGELEITDVLMRYLIQNKLYVNFLSRGTAWLDTGTPDSLHDAASYVRIIHERTGISIGNLVEVANQNSWL
jgi:glucose-1-phosphate thymidylyltransferase